MDDCFKVTLTEGVATFIRLCVPRHYCAEIYCNIVGVKKCISLYGDTVSQIYCVG